jgi:hypothetical protein
MVDRQSGRSGLRAVQVCRDNNSVSSKFSGMTVKKSSNEAVAKDSSALMAQKHPQDTFEIAISPHPCAFGQLARKLCRSTLFP